MFNLTRYLVRQGDLARDVRNWPASQRAYSRALRLNPSLAHIWVQYGHALKEAGSVAQALAACRRSDSLQPDLADTNLPASLPPHFPRARRCR